MWLRATMATATATKPCTGGPGQQLDVFLFLKCCSEEGQRYMEQVSEFVFTNRGKYCTLENPAGATLTIGDLHDTIYSDDELNEWEQFYLPEKVKMQVIGVVENSSCLCDQLVLMTCEDKKVFAYDGEELHEVASIRDLLLSRKLNYEITYYRGEAFKDMTEKDWAEVRKGEVGKRLDEEHHKLVTANKSDFLNNLRLIREKIGVTN